MQTRRRVQTPIPKDFISSFIYNAFVVLILLILFWSILLNQVTQSGHGLDADVRIIYPFAK